MFYLKFKIIKIKNIKLSHKAHITYIPGLVAH